MPEGPSILILKDAVQQFKGRRVTESSSNNKKFDAKMLEGLVIKDFKTWGKHFLICFPKFTIRVHLMMFGSYRVNESTAKPPRLHLQFGDEELNFYACLLELIEEPLNQVYDWSADIMSPKWSYKKAIEKMKDQPTLLACDALMDQHIFSGVGNIIKNEALFRARIHPLSEINKIPVKKLNELMRKTVQYSFEFLDQRKVGTLTKHWQAYNQKECPRNHIPFQKADTGKSHRTSFFCDKCQVKY